MRKIKTTDGQTLFVGWTIPQAGGGVRHLCADTKARADEIRTAIARDPAMVDGVKAITVDGK